MKTKIVVLAVLTTLIAGDNISAQTTSFSRVTFKNDNLKMAGNLYLPPSIDKNKKYPTIVCVHPGGGVKEQTAGLYAQKMAEQGYITLAFDASHQGESEGQPRLLEDPSQRVEDIRSAIDYVTTLSFVDSERIGLLGICAGGGYSISAAKTERRIKAVAVASPVDIGKTFREGWDGKTPVADQIKFLETVAKQRSLEANGAASMYLNYVPEEVDKNTIPDMREAHDYYRTARAQHPNSTNRLLISGVDKIMAFNAFDNIGAYLTQPILIIVGSNAGSRWQGELAYKMAQEPKELFLINGATHMDLYDVPQYVIPAVGKMAAFFNKNL